MKDVLKISILLILALSNGALFAQTNRSLNLNRDTLDIKFVKRHVGNEYNSRYPCCYTCC